MPSVVQTQTISSGSYMLRERPAEPPVSGFTAVNGRGSPPSLPEPRRVNGTNGMTTEPVLPRPLSQIHSPPLEQKPPLPVREEWAAHRPAENGAARHHNHHSVSPTLPPPRDGSPQSPGKRKRSKSTEISSPYPSPTGDSTQSRQHRLDSYASASRDDSPQSISQARPVMEPPIQRTLPPMDVAERDRAWPPQESHNRSPESYPDPQYRDPRAMEPNREPNREPHPGTIPQSNGSTIESERSSTTEITRAGVQVDPKKRKRQFANRTKTGCGTCRRRKKKCDEAKPECNNCMRGGFICEGYANKVPWPKNGITKPHPPLQAKDRYPLDPAQLYHNHTTGREQYSEGPPTDGGRGQPIVIEEHDRRNGWAPAQAPTPTWENAPPRPTYSSDRAPPPPEYGPLPPPPPPPHHPPHSTHPAHPTHPPHSSHPPHPPHPPHALPSPSHPRPPSIEAHPPHPSQNGGPRPHNPRIYHHTPQTMSQVVNTSPAVTAEAALHHQSQQSHPPPMSQPPPTSGPPAPPAHYAPPPPRPQRSEKEKMLNGEPFMPFNPQLLAEREQCKAALYRHNSTANNHLEITRDERDRHFRAIVEARWTQHMYRGREPTSPGSVGTQVFVDTPFHCDYGYNLQIGDCVNIGAQCRFLDSSRIFIGRNTTIQSGVTIDTQKVPTDFKSLKGSRGSAVAAEIYIGENVWIGANSTILAGVRIGTGAIIFPGSVVVRDIPRDVVVRGPNAEVRGVNWDD
ncbi:hypothetical protein BU24DRAFT_164138 [Aaosphaeria arxii CBS 175.79]|uniref:Zn(2)-C6 fungal-type domain-containing protein n=1 Tax=Aaosphaeria arxii CBS 175.79 TaxID=1450172 RepID=A0A6A5XXM7_9PLEO|nr:uncharacterized protein BU24DRAFT_164138 [Aaosphaeria arxii CBS 175.79]KAF2018058.1 hypothetical protein BU24DRAFT_164138 [Aaosphaeria arxii CBS 175.79]